MDILLPLVIALTAAIGAAAPTRPHAGYTLRFNVAYRTPSRGIFTGNLYQPTAKSTRARPALLVLHGGGWADGSDYSTGVRFLSRRLAQAGYVVFNINYRLNRQRGYFPRDIRDVKNALAFMDRNARAWNINPHRVALVGASAGAHLVLMAAYTPNSGGFAIRQRFVKPAAVVGYYTPTDLTQIEHLRGPMRPLVLRLVKGYLHPPHGRLTLALLKKASPISYVKTAVPTMLVQGLGDNLVPPAQAFELARKLKARRIPVQVVKIPGVGHAFNDWRDAARRQALQQVETFLAHRLRH